MNSERHNFLVLTLDGLFFFLGMTFISFETVLPIFLARLGAPRLAIAVIPVATAIGVNLPSILAARMVERAPRKARIAIRYGIVQRLPWAFVALAIPIMAISRSGWLIAVVLLGVLVSTAAAGVSIPAFFNIVTATVPVNRRGRLFAWRSVLSYLFGMGAGVIVRLLLHRVAYPVNYAILFAIATAILFAGLLVLTRIREPITTEKQPAERRPPIRHEIAGILRSNRNFRFYIVSRALLVIAFATTSFFPIYLVERFSLPDSVSGLFALLTAATFVVVNPILGLMADRVGYKSVFLVSFGSLICASVLGLLGVSAPFIYALVALVAVSQSVNLFAWNMTVEFAPEGQVPTYIGVSGLFMGLIAPLALFTGVIVEKYGFNGLFILTSVAATLGLLVMWLAVEEPRVARRRLNQPDVPI
jgi:MFS family permease